MNTFLWQDNIDNTAKERMFNKLHKKNVIGFDLDEKISFLAFPDTFAGKTNKGIFISYENHNHIDIAATRDLVKLFFGGNKQFKGKTADIGNSSLNLLKYKQLQFGVISKFGNEKIQHSIGVGISFNDGIENTSVSIDHGSIFTAKDAEYIDVAAGYDIYLSDTSGKKGSKGFGSSLNLYYSFQTQKNNHFDFSFTDLGFIQWNNNSRHLSKDTTLHFDGVTIDDPLNIEGNIFGDTNPDSILHAFTNADTSHSYFMLTPACFRISYLYNFSENFQLEGSVTKKLYVHYDPLWMLKAQYVCGKNILSLNLNYGGYTGGNPYESHIVNTGLEYIRCFGKGFILLAGTNFLNGFINPVTQTAQGAYVSIKKYFF
jgi:hypothetical protein